jgi:mono/diheme cytochrome c family protein
MRRLRFGVALILIGAVAALVAGCGGSDPNEAKTPANSPTITNGKASPNDQRESPAGRTGNAAAGGILFNRTCQSCHAKGGTEAATGPKLADRGLTAQAVFDQVANGGTVMHSNLVSGADLDNVTAYILSLQAGGTAAAPTPPATTSTPPATTTATPPATGGGGGDAAAVAAGKTFFEGTCQACHTAGGTQAGVGPKLTGLGLTADRITNQIVNGGGAMPPGLASGTDLENVTKFVLSLQ